MQISDIQRHDSKKMYEAYDRWPEISQENYFAKDLPKIQFKNIDHIVFAGVGGSGTIGDVISSILSKNDIHVNVVIGYLLPKTVGPNTLIITTSVSGNSKEALTDLQNVKKSKGKFLAFSSGGKMKKSGNEHWKYKSDEISEEATNESGFTGLPAGYRSHLSYGWMGKFGDFWSSSEYSSELAWRRSLKYSTSEFTRSNNQIKRYGYSIRCIKSAP